MLKHLTKVAATAALLASTAIAQAGAAGNFQLNVMLPLVAYHLLQSIDILSSAARLLADEAIEGFTVNHDNINEALASHNKLDAVHIVSHGHDARFQCRCFARFSGRAGAAVV